MTQATTDHDVEVAREGGLFLFALHTDAARTWVEEHVSDDATWFGDRLVVEHGYARDLAQGMLDDGLRVV